MTKKTTKLRNLKVGEVSLVNRAANKRSFLILKEDNMEDILKAVLETDLDNEERVDEVIEKAGLSEKAAVALKGALRLLSAYKEEMPKELMAELMGLGGRESDDEDEKEAARKRAAEAAARKEKKEMEKEEVKKEKLTFAPVQKDDGSFDFSGVSEEVRPMVEMLFKECAQLNREKEQLVAKAAQLEGDLKAEQDRRRTEEFVRKAADFENLPIDAEEFGPVIKAISDAVPAETYSKLEQVLKAADEGLRQAGSLRQVGKDVHKGTGNSAWDRIEAKAKEIVQKSDGLTHPKAIERVIKENPDLYTEYLREQKEGRN